MSQKPVESNIEETQDTDAQKTDEGTPEMDVDLGYEEAPKENTESAEDDNIPVLEPIDAEPVDFRSDVAPATVDDEILTLSEIVEDDEPLILTVPETPEPAPAVESIVPPAPTPAAKPAATSPPPTPAPPQQKAPNFAPQAPASVDQSTNPFLPKQLIDKLDEGRKSLEDDIMQSSASLDMSTALLRTHARADRMNNLQSSNNPFSAKDSVSQQKQKLVDEVVDEYLPLLAAEMRRRLHKLLDDQ